MAKTKTLKVSKTPRAGALVMADDLGFRFYVLRRTKTGRWELPGGRVDAGERICDGAAREVSEEIGVQVEVLGKIAHTTFARGSKAISYTAYAMRALGTPVLEAGFDAIAEVSWAELELLPLADSLAAVRDAVHA